MADIHDVCDYVIAKLTEGEKPLNVMKLHKLLYYIQAWSLAFDQAPAFEGRFQAWVHGPVNRPTFDRFAGLKSMYSLIQMEDVRNGFDPCALPEKEREHIDAVLEVYGPLTGDQLEEMTHREEPWRNARRGLAPPSRSERLLSEDDMRNCLR